jgi:flagellar export protein FliJ
MKKFDFPLRRVLDWRRTQVQVEESKLERLYANLRDVETRLRETYASREQAGRDVVASGSATGGELVALGNFRKAAAAECARLAEAVAALRKSIAAQLQVVVQKRRDVKLLEHLHTRKLETWNAELAREIDTEAGELHLAKLHRAASPVK